MITYKTTREFSEKELENIFLSVNWSSGKYPDKLVIAMKNSDHVLSAWDGDKLVGLMNTISDKIMTTYFNYLLVKPEYQAKGIGQKLVEMMLDKYKDFARKVLIAYDTETGFYEKCGFVPANDKTAMFITYLTT